MGSRPYPYNINDAGYAKEKVPGLLDISCARTLTPLSGANVRSEVNDATTEDLLRQCDASDENYYDAEDAAQLAAAFAEIGQKMTSLHLGK